MNLTCTRLARPPGKLDQSAACVWAQSLVATANLHHPSTNKNVLTF